MSSRSQDASGYSMTRYKQWNAQRKGYNRQPNSPESDLTNTSTEMNSSSMRRAIRSQYRRMQEVIAALGVCVCVCPAFEPRLKIPGNTSEPHPREQRRAIRFTQQPHNPNFQIPMKRGGTAVCAFCCHSALLRIGHAGDAPRLASAVFMYRSAKVTVRARCSATQETTIILVHCSDSESEADERPSQCELSQAALWQLL